MNLLIVDNKPIRRGAQMFGQHFKEYLNANGHECMRVFLYHPGDETSMLPLDGQDVLLQGKKNHPFELFPSVQPKLCRNLAARISDFKPDVVLLNGGRAVKYGAAVKRWYYSGRAVFVVRIIDSVVYWNTSRIRQWYSRNVATPQMDGAVGVGARALEEYRELYGFTGPGTAIPRAFNFSEFDKQGSKTDARALLEEKASGKVILFLGNITQQKRPDRFVRVFRKVRERMPDARAWIVGDGRLRDETEEQVKQFGLTDKVRFFGYQKNVQPFITGSDLLFISSDTEGVPGIALESLYLERPVVTTRAGDVGMVVINGKTGYLCEPDSESDQAEKITELLLDEEKAAEMGKEGRRHVIHNFNLPDLAGRYLRFFEEVQQKQM